MFKVLLKWREQKKYKKYMDKQKPLYKKIIPKVLMFLFCYLFFWGSLYFKLNQAEKNYIHHITLAASLFSTAAMYVYKLLKADYIKFFNNHICISWIFKDVIKYEKIKAFYIYEMLLGKTTIYLLFIDVFKNDCLGVKYIEINDNINHDDIRAVFSSKGIIEQEVSVSLLHTIMQMRLGK